jgi:transposase
MGPILGAQFLVATDGRALDAFAGSGRLASYAGLVPVPKDSGRVSGNYRRPKRFHRPLHNVFYMMALSSLRADGPPKVFYQHKRDENKIHTQALLALALARRMVDLLWALLRDNREFSPFPPSQVITAAA